jgi:Ca2+-dependent lipid-binding protein
LNPTWNAEFRFDYSKEAGTKLEIFLFDYDKGSEDELMGYIELDCRKATGRETDIPLMYHPKMKVEHKGKVQGSMKVRVRLCKCEGTCTCIL